MCEPFLLLCNPDHCIIYPLEINGDGLFYPILSKSLFKVTLPRDGAVQAILNPLLSKSPSWVKAFYPVLSKSLFKVTLPGDGAVQSIMNPSLLQIFEHFTPCRRFVLQRRSYHPHQKVNCISEGFPRVAFITTHHTCVSRPALVQLRRRLKISVSPPASLNPPTPHVSHSTPALVSQSPPASRGDMANLAV